MNEIIRKIVSLRKENKIEMGDKMVPIKKNQPNGKNIMERKKIQERENSKKEFTRKFAKQISDAEMQRIFQHSGIHKDRLYGQLQNKIMWHRNNIALTKGVVPDPRKRQFIKKGILGIIAGVGIAVFSKMTRAVQNINFDDSTSASIK